MRIADDGNLGIGTTSPSAKLEISGKNDVSGDIKARFISYGNSAYETDTGIWLGAAYSTSVDTAKAAIISQLGHQPIELEWILFRKFRDY